MRRAAALVLLVAMLLGGCRSGGRDGAEPSADCTRFVLFDDDAWEFREAVDYPADVGSLPDRSLDWYAEFERLTPSPDGSTEGTSLSISGHDAGIDDLRRGQLRAIDLHSHRSVPGILVGSSPDGPSSLVAKPISDNYTLIFLSYGLDVDELVAVTAASRPVCQQEWVDAGGQILDCMPTEPGCISEK